MNDKINRCCTPIKKGKIIYIGVKDDILTNGDTYIWLSNNIICKIDPISKNINHLKEHLRKGNILKLIGSNNINDTLPLLPSKFVNDFNNIKIKLKLKNLTVKYTYDIVGGIRPMNAERSNYRPKLINNTIKLTIFETRTKIYK